jgi:transposase
MVAAFDVGKDVLDMSLAQKMSRLGNRQAPIKECLDALPAGCAVAMESTSTYHRLLASSALERNLPVYVVNPKRFAAYRKSEAVRGKTDRLDAQTLELYVSEKKDRLHPYSEPSAFCQELRELVVRRQTLVAAKGQALASLEGVGTLQAQRQAIEKVFTLTLKEIDARIAQLLSQSQDAGRLLKVPGFGSLVTAGLLCLLDRYQFASADAFVAYLGLDPRPNDSAKRKGTRYLSCEGDSSVRRLLFNAAMAGSRTPSWKPYYQKQRDKGLAATPALLILATKMARTAWSMHKHQAEFHSLRIDKPT